MTNESSAATEPRIAAIKAQARRVIDAKGGVALWIALWELRSLLIDIESLDLPRPGGSA